MEEAGIELDTDIFKKLSKNSRKDIKNLEKVIYRLAGETFKINSPKELIRIFFEKLKLSSKGIRKTGAGKLSTKASELEKLRGAHPIIKEIIKYRELSKLFSTYIDVLPKLVDQNSRIHTTFHQTGTVTGRLSSSDPNLQNIPARSDIGDEIRRAFRASRGTIFLAFDYSQIQLRIAAHLSGDKKMLSVFEQGKDIHSATAADIFKVSENDVTSDMRRRAKVINFGILYGMGAQSLSENIGVSRAEAELFLQEYFMNFSGLASYFEKIKEQARELGYAETLFGRKRFLPEINSNHPIIRREAERMAVNAPIQGSEADIVKIAMVKVYDHIKTRGFDQDIVLLLQIHDELLCEVNPKKERDVAKILVPVLEGVCGNVPHLPVEVKSGPSWGDLKPLVL